jgi:hypothetical protein
MQILRRVWNDIKRGENIDLYITVCAAFLLVILNILGFASSTWIAPLTLAILGLLSISLLGNRHSMEEFVEKLSHANETFFMDEYPSSLKSDFSNATEIWLVGVNLNRTIRDYYSEIENKLRTGKTIRVLLVHPDGPSPEIAASRTYSGVDVTRTRARINDTLQYLCDLKQIAPNSLQIRTIQNPLTFGAMAINPNSLSGILYMEHFPFRTANGSLPKFVLRGKDGQWYEFFKKELTMLWENGTDWQCSNPKSNSA